MEQQLLEIERKPASGARKAREKQLVADVYRRHGSSVEIRNAVEADCVAEKERDAKAAALVKALGLKPGAVQAPGAAPASPEQIKAAEDKRRQEAAARAAERKEALCRDLVREDERLRDCVRAVGIS